MKVCFPELSEVLWEMVLSKVLEKSGPFSALILFVASLGFSILTLAVLVVMEGLSAFVSRPRAQNT